MKIVINGESCEVVAGTLADLLKERALAGRVATAVNETFVPAAQRPACKLQEGDRVEILAPMQGG
ncbi:MULTISPECIES: sulfur carrier protein ThiS [Mameliella]|uniref:sulfur carrier protein ThiS n=1 Tax=Mameliella TaxID=1434019 RepID=UPI0008411FD0|nr:MULTISPECIES: sulfur carrier protein ThiS [Mameliella]MBV6638041.1 sulfur carrier protein ThiS [Mameliella sp.]ODM50061.1 thiamine biosynthesis protein ThiS [Ruegeria sp. PBVC088]MBY6121590.1 sulfur carrier protein ThiS [Mameliella alba]MDD9731249.1 sulfur carrier protein ThiS [Mameliella sp. AT18]OWV40632.1 thiamine biosynthesis protein ThiS [Mameliella alba]